MKTIFSFAFIVAAALFGLPTLAHADGSPAAQSVMVVTLTSSMVQTDRIGTRKVVENPIQVVDGGVKSMPGSCFDLNASGHVTQTAGNCVVLRSAPSAQQN